LKFKIDDQQTKEIHFLLDKTYEDLITDGPATDKIFKDAQNKNICEEDPLLWSKIE